MMKQISIDAITSQMLEVIELLKNNTDADASPNEKIDNDTAKVIAELGKVAIEGYKVKAQVLNTITKTMNPDRAKTISVMAGIFCKKKQNY
jgi:hypothetical protein